MNVRVGKWWGRKTLWCHGWHYYFSRCTYPLKHVSCSKTYFLQCLDTVATWISNPLSTGQFARKMYLKWRFKLLLHNMLEAKWKHPGCCIRVWYVNNSLESSYCRPSSLRFHWCKYITWWGRECSLLPCVHFFSTSLNSVFPVCDEGLCLSSFWMLIDVGHVLTTTDHLVQVLPCNGINSLLCRRFGNNQCGLQVWYTGIISGLPCHVLGPPFDEAINTPHVYNTRIGKL